MKRRDFMKAALAVPFIGAAGTGGAACSQAAERRVGDNAPCQGLKHPLTGKKLPPWTPGEFQVHFIYTGVAESMFWIMIDTEISRERIVESRESKLSGRQQFANSSMMK